jgi:integrase
MVGQIISRGKNTWLVRVFMGRDPQTGKRQYLNQTVHGTKKDAEGVLTKKMRDRDTGHLTMGSERSTVGGLLDDLLDDYKINGKDYRWAEGIVRLYLRPTFGQVPISKLSTTMVRAYIAERQKNGATNATINRSLALLKRSLYMGHECTPPRVGQVPYIPMLEENNVRKGFFEYSEFIALRDALPAEVKPVLTFAYYTGCRRGEIVGLQWSQVDLLERAVRLEPGTTKNDEAREIPIGDELFQVLKFQREERDREYPACPWVFHREGKPLVDFRGAWEAGCLAAGLWKGDPKTGKPTKLFHDLRRTGVRNLVRAGAPERVVMAISGHKTRSVFDRYNIVSGRDLRDAVRRQDAYVQEQSAHKPESWHTIGTQTAEQGKSGKPQ